MNNESQPDVYTRQEVDRMMSDLVDQINRNGVVAASPTGSWWTIDKPVVPKLPQTVDLGNATTQFRDAHIESIYTNSIQTGAAHEDLTIGGLHTGTVRFKGALIGVPDSCTTIGDESHWIGTIYVNDLVVNTINGQPFSSFVRD